MSHSHDRALLRALAEQYMAVAASPVQEERRRLWSALNGLRSTRPAIIWHVGMWNAWCRELFGDQALKCEDPCYRGHEQSLRFQLFLAGLGDDTIFEPWYSVRAVYAITHGSCWGEGLGGSVTASEFKDGAVKYHAPLQRWDDMEKLTVPHHVIDEQATREQTARLQEVFGDVLPIEVVRGPMLVSLGGDICSTLCQLRGMEQVMEDMYDAPEELHRLLAFLRDGILGVQEEAERAGDMSLTSQFTQSICYCDGMEPPQPHAGPRTRKDLWLHCAAQELTLVSPAMHDEFMLQYQLPIISQWGKVAYGCCEDLTRKIDMLRQVPNLRSIAVAPSANVARCAEQIGADYVISWRPNPTDLLCGHFDEADVRRRLRDGLQALQGCHVEINMKDVETVEGDLSRFARFTRIAHEVIEEMYAGV